ncbi:spermatogenesis-associated protein 7 isoform X2 [Hirundo rustica]|uniref:spermatogenesis-associated protein 7 isoform X2 n=1 Tax=Hirundo rustica TaxID=43150 RepID=UPI001A94BF0A|nr:spermatogenesis-associated protein 7 isoform X2 [Hirundo rustica]
MGLKKNGGRRCQVHECSALVPRCGPCKGHLSTKSNAFCVDSCRNLTSQYLIRDHMVFHYNRILSAKAAVDCSVPKSRLTCIKFADQQRREKLKKKISKCEEKMSVCEAVPQSSSGDDGRLLPSTFRKSFLEVEDNPYPCAGQAQYLSWAPSPHGEHCLVHSSPVKHTRKCSWNTSRIYHSNSNVCLSRPSKHCALSHSHSTESVVSVGCSKRRQGSNPRESCGDLLERHSECFTKVRKPFTPRTLISDAKPFLSEYRYYTPARRKKKNRHRHCVEAQTQTDVISFPSADKVYVRKVTSEQQTITSEAEDKRCTCDEPEGGIDGFQCSKQRETSWHPQKSSPRRTVSAEEEELLYLTFIEDVTNEILRLGLFSNRVLDQLFECHIEANKNRLDEGRMRQMLDVLKSDLGCGQDSETELIHAGQDSLDPLDLQEHVIEELGFTRKGHRLRKCTKSEEFLSTMDSSKCESLSWSEGSAETQSREDSSEDSTEMRDAATESEFCDVEFEEHPDTSPRRCEAALNSIACDSDLELKKELDELEADFADLHLSHKYS